MNGELCELASQSLTEARSEYNKALPPVAAAQDKIFDHAPETKTADLSRLKIVHDAPNYATDFATEYFLHKTTHFIYIITRFS